MSSIFDPQRCDVEQVPRIAQFQFDECEIPDPPEMIEECPLFDLPIPGSSLCPQFEVTSGVVTLTTIDEPPSVTVAIEPVTDEEGDPVECTFGFALDLQIPCADIELTGAVSLAHGTPASLEIVPDINTSIGDRCDYDFQFNFEIPCPTFEVSSSVATTVTEGGVPEVEVSISPNSSSGEECGFDFNFDFGIPCPGVQLDARLTLAHGVQSGIFIEREPAGEEACNWLFDLGLNIPCPTINLSTANSSVTLFEPSVDKETCILASIEPNLNEEGVCGFDFNLSLDIPCPSLTFSGSSAITYVSEVEYLRLYDPIGTLGLNLPILDIERQETRTVLVPQCSGDPEGPWVNTTEGASGPCDYEFAMNFTLPCPKISLASRLLSEEDEDFHDYVPEGAQAPYLATGFEEVYNEFGQSCNYAFNLALWLPQQGPTAGGQRVAYVLVENDVSCHDPCTDGTLFLYDTVTSDDGAEWTVGQPVEICASEIDGMIFRNTVVTATYREGIWEATSGGVTNVRVKALEDIAVGTSGECELYGQNLYPVDPPVIDVRALRYPLLEDSIVDASWNKTHCRWETSQGEQTCTPTEPYLCSQTTMTVKPLLGGTDDSGTSMELTVYNVGGFEGIAIPDKTMVRIEYDEQNNRHVAYGHGPILAAQLAEGEKLTADTNADAVLKYWDQSAYTTVDEDEITVEADCHFQAVAFPTDCIRVYCARSLADGIYGGKLVAIENGRMTIFGEVDDDLSGAADTANITVQGAQQQVETFFSGDITSGTKVAATWDVDGQTYFITAADCAPEE